MNDVFQRYAHNDAQIHRCIMLLIKLPDVSSSSLNTTNEEILDDETKSLYLFVGN